jgi:hypothetical protein
MEFRARDWLSGTATAFNEYDSPPVFSESQTYKRSTLPKPKRQKSPRSYSNKENWKEENGKDDRERFQNQSFWNP